MSLQTNIKNLRSERGFTIVELLIVIVVIAILAAITIVAFNGVTARANTSSAQAAASTVLKKVEAFKTQEASAYPTTTAALTGASSNEPWYVAADSVTFADTLISAQPPKPATINLISCTSGGMIVSYWKYDGSATRQDLKTGNTTGCTPGAAGATIIAS